jgi:hypothetical protein
MMQNKSIADGVSYMEIIKDDIEDNLRKNAKRYLNNTVIYRISQKRWILSKRRRSCRGLHHPA